MKNWKRILAAVGTAALLVSNLGAVSQVVFAEEGDIVEQAQEGSSEDITEQVQALIDDALETPIAETAEEEAVTPVAETEGNESAEGETDPAEDEAVVEDTTAASTESTEDAVADTVAEDMAEDVSDDADTASEEIADDETADAATEENVDGETADVETTEDESAAAETTEATTEELTEDLLDETGVEAVTEEDLTEETEELISPAYEDETPVEGENGITVKAVADENVLPEDAVLVASMITRENDETEYNKVEEALVESDEVAYTAEDAAAAESVDENADAGNSSDAEGSSAGFIAMDIRFEVTDEETGEVREIEPQGAVAITFDIEEDVLPADADPDSLTVHHLEEDENGKVEQVVTVADTDDTNDETGLVEVQETEEDVAPATTVEFEVESFSTFSICWKAPNRFQEDETIVVHYVDTNGNEIETETSVDITEEDGSGGFRYLKEDGTGMIDLRFFARDISGYTFESIKAKGRANANVPNKYSASDTGIVDAQFMGWIFNSKYAGGNSLRYYSFAGINDDDEVQYNELGEYGQAVDVFIVYREGRTEASDKQNITPTVEGDKTIVNNNDGTYSITIDAAAKAGSGEEKQKVDILFVLDTSSSMIKNWVNTERTVNRATAAENAILAAVNTLEDNSENVDAHYGLVTFSTYATVGKSLTYVKDDDGEYSFSDNSGNYILNTGTHYSWKLIGGYYEDSSGKYIKDDKNEYIDTDGNKYKREYVGYGVHQDLSKTPITQNLLDQVSYAGDTNYEAAMIATRQAMEQARPDAKKVVIFLTDGTPTRAYGNNTYEKQNIGDGRIEGTGKESQDVKKKQGFLNRALKELKSQKLHLSGSTHDAFYAVGLGVTTDKKGNDNYKLFVEPLADNDNFADGVTSEAFKVDDDADSLANKFQDIIAKEISIEATNAVLEDPLSENVEVVTRADSSYDLEVRVTDSKKKVVPDSNQSVDGYQIKQKVEETGEDGTKTEVEKEFTITSEVVTKTNTSNVDGQEVTTTQQVIKLTFPEGYILESGYTYSIVAKVKPTAKAFEQYRALELYDTTDSTHVYPDEQIENGKDAGTKGFYTNSSYTETKEVDGVQKTVTVNPRITYQYKDVNGNWQDAAYEYDDKPVIQLHPGYLTITKNITGLDAGHIDSAVSNTQFKVTVTKPDGTTKIYDKKVYQLDVATEANKDIKVDGGFIKRTDNGNNRTYVITLYGLDTGSTYTVTEANPTAGSQPGEVEGFDVDNGTTEVSSTEKTLVKWDTASATTFKNTYSKKIVKTGVTTDNNMLPAVVATIDIMAVMAVLYTVAKRRVR